VFALTVCTLALRDLAEFPLVSFARVSSSLSSVSAATSCSSSFSSASSQGSIFSFFAISSTSVNTPVAGLQICRVLLTRRTPHQGIANGLPVWKRRRKKPSVEPTIRLADVGCKARLGGLLKHYYRKAA
jgi:hypothetical protein